MIRKQRRRYPGISDLEEQAIRLFHFYREDFPGISFEYKVQIPGKTGITKKTIIDKRGKLRLDQNDGTPVPDVQYPNALLRDGSRSLQDDLPVETGKKVDGVDISEQIDNVVNEPKDKERSTNQTLYTELTHWKFRKGQHITLYLSYEAKLDAGSDGSVKITIIHGMNVVQHENSKVTSTWTEYTDTKDISTLDDGWCKINLAAKIPPLGAETIFVRTFTISIRRT